MRIDREERAADLVVYKPMEIWVFDRSCENVPDGCSVVEITEGDLDIVLAFRPLKEGQVGQNIYQRIRETWRNIWANVLGQRD